MTYVVPGPEQLSAEAYSPDDDLAFLAWELAYKAHRDRGLRIDAAFDIAALLKSYFRHIEANFPNSGQRDFELRLDYFEELNDSLAMGMSEIAKDKTYTS